MLKAVSHLVIATNSVDKITDCWIELFKLTPHFRNKEFSEFVLPSGFRIAFFIPVGKSKERFDASGSRAVLSIGMTVENVDATYQYILTLEKKWNLELSGPPKEHPWGAKSFLLIDYDQNRIEVTQSPTPDGTIPNM